MAFISIHSDKIWRHLFTVRVPDIMTTNPEYLKTRGIYTSGNKNVDDMVKTDFTTVMVTIADMLVYYEDGVDIIIPSRKDMIRIHESIELYLDEWRNTIDNSVNVSPEPHKKLLTALENLSCKIYGRISNKEYSSSKNNNDLINLLGIRSANAVNREVEEKPKYNKITDLFKHNKQKSFRG